MRWMQVRFSEISSNRICTTLALSASGSGFRSGVSCHFIDSLRPLSTVNTVPQSQRNPLGPISLHSPFGTGSMLNSTNFSFDHVYSFGHQWVSLLIKKSNAFSRGTDISMFVVSESIAFFLLMFFSFLNNLYGQSTKYTTFY